LASNNKYFSLEKKSEEKEENISAVFNSKFLNFHYEKLKSLEENLTRLPTPEEIFFLQSDNAFNAFTFIPFIAKRFPVKELHASTYSISRKVIEALIEMHDKGMIEQITLLISDSMIKRNPSVIDNLHAMASTRPNITVLYAWSHAKVCCIKTHDFHYVIEGSGNWSDNAHYEQYILCHSKSVYEFRMQLFTNSNLKKY
jgi:hypothetical protein